MSSWFKLVRFSFCFLTFLIPKGGGGGLRRFPRRFSSAALNRPRQRFHGNKLFWNRYEIGTDKPCVYTGPGTFGTDRIRYLVPNGSTYEGDPI